MKKEDFLFLSQRDGRGNELPCTILKSAVTGVSHDSEGDVVIATGSDDYTVVETYEEVMEALLS